MNSCDVSNFILLFVYIQIEPLRNKMDATDPEECHDCRLYDIPAPFRSMVSQFFCSLADTISPARLTLSRIW